MLPDLPKIKHEILLILMELFRTRVNHHMGFFNQLPHRIIKEGNLSILHRADNSEEEVTTKPVSSLMHVGYEEVETISNEEILQKIDLAAREMAEQMHKNCLNTISSAVEKVGNTIDAQGNGFTPDLLLACLEKIQIDFDEANNPIMPTLLHNMPEDKLRKLMAESNTAEFEEKYSQLVQTKWVEWRDRETSRKLVG